ncbi:hypothetical protein AB0J90_30765 [Micromonospora sp. NPDC049523]|uniref:hypothetical protein n=1 Tax=Micromonospora sp. NPDC049523 TaxID=3155921 RepID=UPI0034418ACE
MTDHVDPDLAEGLGPEVADVLGAWAELHDRYYQLDYWLVNGRSRAPVAVVTETDLRRVAIAQLVLKVLTVSSGGIRDLEYGRHLRAVEQAGSFARHLSRFVHEAIPAGTKRWITFQSVAGETLGNSEVLTVLLRRMLGISTDPEPTKAAPLTCDPPTFAAACARVVRGVLNEWAGPPFTPPGETWDLPHFFRQHIFDQMDEGGRLHGWADRHQGSYLSLPGESTLLPNPFAVARGEFFDPAVVVRPLIGRTHGDLHTDNALIQVRPTIEPSAFYLIDTALYEDSGPLTRDPVHFVLYVIARSMEAIAPAQHAPLIDLLLDPPSGPAHLLPGWLAMLVRQTDAEAIAWVRPSGLEDRWRSQTLLSIAACALLFLGRSSTPEKDKPFFLRLAARAVARFADTEPRRARPTGAGQDSDAGRPSDGTRRVAWIGWLCREYPHVRTAAGLRGWEDEAEQFRDDALGGLDRTDDLTDFVRRLGGPTPDPRFGTSGSEGQPVDEAYLCPIELCPRREQRPPGGPVPVCHLTRDQPRRMRSSLG